MKLRLLFIGLLACVAVVWPAVSHAAGSQPIAVQVIATSRNNNFAGSNLAYDLRENIRKSSAYRLTSKNEFRYIIHLTSIKTDPSGNEIAYSVVYSAKANKKLPEFYLSDYVGICGSNRIQSCATDILATLDQQIHSSSSN